MSNELKPKRGRGRPPKMDNASIEELTKCDDESLKKFVGKVVQNKAKLLELYFDVATKDKVHGTVPTVNNRMVAAGKCLEIAEAYLQKENQEEAEQEEEEEELLAEQATGTSDVVSLISLDIQD